MNFINKYKNVTAITSKCRALILTTSPSVQCIHQFRATTPQRNKNNVLTNLCEKFGCTEDIAKDIYIKFPSLRSYDAIRMDSLELLREQISSQSIVENPSLVTMDISKKMPISF